MATTQLISTLQKGDRFRTFTPEHKIKINANISAMAPDHISKTLYVYVEFDEIFKCHKYVSETAAPNAKKFLTMNSDKLIIKL